MSQLVIHVIPAIPACPVRPKSGHLAYARVHHFLIVPVFFQAGPARRARQFIRYRVPRSATA